MYKEYRDVTLNGAVEQMYTVRPSFTTCLAGPPQGMLHDGMLRLHSAAHADAGLCQILYALYRLRANLSLGTVASCWGGHAGSMALGSF